MYVRVHTVDGKNRVTITISKFTNVLEFKKLVEKELEINTSKQRLFYRGKQLEDEYSICDYDINVNDVIQLMVRPDEDELVRDKSNNVCQDLEESVEEEVISCTSNYFKVGDFVDAKDTCFGAWFEGKIIDIFKISSTVNNDSVEVFEENDGVIYKVLLNSYPYNNPLMLGLNDVRPRARSVVPPASIRKDKIYMVNYNVERPSERGFWYDLKVTSVISKNSKKTPIIMGSLKFGTQNNTLDDCEVKFIEDIMNIDTTKLIINRTQEELEQLQIEPEVRTTAPFCEHCHDRNKKCTYCNCHVCGEKAEPEKQILCDECNMAYHIWCIKPPLDKVPEVDEWYCMECKNDENEIVKAGGKLKKIKKKMNSENSRNKGRGMACVGKSKECTIVPLHHFGQIPGIEVGTSWKFRMQVAEAGVHRPPVAGIHGRETDGAYSIVLSGGYEDDEDNGDEIIYTGSGGRDLTGRRAAEQSCDQKLTRLNKALALNCNAEFNSSKGAEAEDWREGRPVRVIRNFRGAKHSGYAPKEGNRYDGLYKVVKYYPEKGKSGFIVWRYLLKRDDPVPAPWTKEGKERIKSLGLEILYPDGYMAAMENRDKENSPINKKKRRGGSFKLINIFPTKRLKVNEYELEEVLKKEIAMDVDNVKLWDAVKKSLSSGKKAFLDKVLEEFKCICCQELIFQPVTLKCKHSVCMNCLQRSFNAKLFICPHCRFELGKNYQLVENKNLQKVLLNLFPGYTAGR